MMISRLFLHRLPFLALMSLSGLAGAAEMKTGPFLFQGVAAAGDRIVFALGGALWRTGSDGGIALPLTSGRGGDQRPVLSPDGRRLAFMREAIGGGDLFLMDLETGEERRMTWHSRTDHPVGFSRDGRRILFASNREDRFVFRLYEMEIDGVFPKPLPLPTGYGGAYGPDNKLIYLPYSNTPEFNEFRHYRGGRMSPLWLTDPETGKTETLVDGEFNARTPMWSQNTLYYLSDRDGTTNIYRYHKGSRDTQLTRFQRFGVRDAATAGNAIVFTRDGFMYSINPNGESARKLDLRVPLDFSERRQRIVDASNYVEQLSLVPGRNQIAISARGDVFSYDPAERRSRNLTRSSGVADRDGVIAPDGIHLAYMSDGSGDYRLHIRNLETGKVQAYDVEEKPAWYRNLLWSPDSRYLSFDGSRLDLFLFDANTHEIKRIDQSGDSAQAAFNAQWSANGRYLTYEKRMKSRMPAIHIYDTQNGSSHGITDGSVYSHSPVFDPGGRYLYFLSSPNAAGADIRWSVASALFAYQQRIDQLQVVILQKDGSSPISPGSNRPVPGLNWSTDRTVIDFSGIDRRIVPIDTGVPNIQGLMAAAPGNLYVVRREWEPAAEPISSPRMAVYNLDLRNPGTMTQLVHAVDVVSNDGMRLLYRNPDRSWSIMTPGDQEPEHKRLRMHGLPAPVDSGEEWSQIYWESWRIMDHFFYDPGHHGNIISDGPGSNTEAVSLTGNKAEALDRHYAAWLPNINNRKQLNLLINRALGHVSVSHMGVGGGDTASRARTPPVGLLGADYDIHRGHYRFTKIIRSPHYATSGEGRFAPLDQPGNRVEEGEYLLAVDGKPVTADRNLYQYFTDKANRTVHLVVGPNPNGAGSRQLTVVTHETEDDLRRAHQAEIKRQKVADSSGGKLEYLYIGRYNAQGIKDFLRGYYSASQQKGLVIDQRFNPGGITSDSLIGMLQRDPLYHYAFREGERIPMPVNPAPRASVLLINQWNASAAETFAFMFKLGGIGKIVGKTTMGAGIGPYSFQPDLIDGGNIRIPNRAAFDPAGNWGIENIGVKPDSEVDVRPLDWRAGRDRQLEEAVRLALEQIRKPAESIKQPAFPIH